MEVLNKFEETNNEMRDRILLVDDEPDILEFLSYNLEKAGYIVSTANGGREAINIAAKILPDLIILDMMMPEMDGIETCIELKENPKLKNSVIVFLTARNEDYSQVAGLDAGADDYISKPIKPRVFVSKIKSLLRRTEKKEAIAQIKEVKGIKVDREKYSVEKNGVALNLPKKEFELLSLLMSKPDKVFSRDAILNAIWGEDVIVGGRTVDVHIRKLREKLGEQYIKTLKGVGYKFES